MSDTAQGPGWWLASDGKWYPPQPLQPAPPPPMHPPTANLLPKKPVYKRVWFWLLIAVVVLFGGCASLVAVASVAVNNANKKQHTVVYSVTGDGTVDITYAGITTGNSGSAQLTGQSLPWSRTVVGTGLFNLFSVNATMVTGSTVTCSITVDGKLLSTHTSTGTLATATCEATAT